MVLHVLRLVVLAFLCIFIVGLINVAIKLPAGQSYMLGKRGKKMLLYISLPCPRWYPVSLTAGGDFLIESISTRTHAYEMLHEKVLEGVVQKEHDLRDLIDQAVDRMVAIPKPGEARHLRFDSNLLLPETSAASVPSALKGKGHPILETDGE